MPSSNWTVLLDEPPESMVVNAIVRTTPRLWLRMVIGLRLFALAAWVMGCEYAVEWTDDEAVTPCST